MIDPDGYVLSTIGSAQTLKDAKKINLVEGVRWTEEEVGTNAIGSALIDNETIMVMGAEHYAMASHQWACSAAPIRDDDGNLT